jgi:hypothetical protein
MSDSFEPEEGPRIYAALVKALAEAKMLADAGDVGPTFRDVLQHAREMYDLLLEQMVAAEPGAGEYLMGMCDAMGNKLDALEMLANGGNPAPLH